MATVDKTELVATLYQSAVEPSLWPTVLDQLALAFEAHSGHVIVMTKDERPPTRLAGNGWSDTAQQLYQEHYVFTDPYLGAQRAGFSTGVLLTQDVLPTEAWADQEIYYDFTRHHGGAYHSMAATVDLHDDLQAALVVFRLRDAEPFDERSRIEMAGIARHGEAALRLRQRLDGSFTGASIRSAVLDGLQHGVVVVDARGSVVYVNRTAELMAASCSLTFSASTGFRAGSTDDTARITRLVREACTGHAGGSLGLHAAGNVHVALTVTPLPLSLAGQLSLPCRLGSGLALITLRRLAPSRAPDPRQAMDIFGLTPAEATCLPALLRGETTEAIARARCLSHHTVRAHVRAILAKTGAANLRALGALLARLSPG
jgi:DNA-binding CsgD family transcriptional regulator/PAS domain-containing protein